MWRKGNFTCMDVPTLPVEVVESKKNVLDDALGDVEREYAIWLHGSQRLHVGAQYVSNKADMSAGRAICSETVSEGEAVRETWMV